MASVDFQKMHSREQIKNYITHDLSAEHREQLPNVNSSLTHLNLTAYDLDEEETYNRFIERIQYLDTIKGQNKRKDRVECFSLVMQLPEELRSQEDKAEAFRYITEMFQNRFGFKNIINIVMHDDEHNLYIRDNSLKVSRTHIHALIIPAIDNKLRGKEFSSRANMTSLNKEIDDYFMSRFQCHFLTGEKLPKNEIGELQQQSLKELHNLLNNQDRIIPNLRSKDGSLVAIKPEELNALNMAAEMYNNVAGDKAKTLKAKTDKQIAAFVQAAYAEKTVIKEEREKLEQLRQEIEPAIRLREENKKLKSIIKFVLIGLDALVQTLESYDIKKPIVTALTRAIGSLKNKVKDIINDSEHHIDMSL